MAMDWVLLILPVTIGLYLCFLLAIRLADTGYAHIAEALDNFHEELQLGAARARENVLRRTARKRAERRFAVAADAGGSVDHDAVEAMKEMPALRRVMDEELPKAIVRCLAVHRLSAAAVGARHIREVAYEPECLGSRYRVIGLAEAAMEILERYPYLVEDPGLMANLIALRSRIVPICSQCPYLNHMTENAPLLCPTAITARISPERFRDG